MYAIMCSRRIHLHGFPRDWGEADQLVVPCIVFLTFLEAGCNICLDFFVERNRMVRFLSQVSLVKY